MRRREFMTLLGGAAAAWSFAARAQDIPLVRSRVRALTAGGGYLFQINAVVNYRNILIADQPDEGDQSCHVELLSRLPQPSSSASPASRRFQLTLSREEDGLVLAVRALAIPALVLALHRCAAEWRSASEPLRLVPLPRAERTGLINADMLPIHLATRT